MERKQTFVGDPEAIRRASSLANELKIQLRAVLDVAQVLIAYINPDGSIRHINRRGLQVLGYEPGEVQGRDWFDLIVPHAEREKARLEFEASIEEKGRFNSLWEGTAITKEGDHRMMVWKRTLIKDHEGTVQGQMLSGDDVTDYRRAEARISDMAYRDQLTGLPNRAALHEELEPILEAARRADRSVALLFMDFDNFKRTNDTYGHHVGDDMLREITARLRKATRTWMGNERRHRFSEDTAATPREGDLLVRQGGDEFLLLLPDLPGDLQEAWPEVAAVAGRLNQAFHQPMQLGPHLVQTGVSIGISMFPHDAHDDVVLLQHADMAMYAVKRTGRGKYAFFQPGMEAAH